MARRAYLYSTSLVLRWIIRLNIGVLILLFALSPVVVPLFFNIVKAAGTTYYVDCNRPDDTGNGTSQGTAWKTINKVNISSFSAGDSILFNKGCMWREQLTVPSSGSAGSPITFGAYGSGAQPIISGADVLSSWTLESETGGTNYTSGYNLDGWWRFQDSGNMGTDSSGAANTLTVNGGPISQVAGPNTNVPEAASLVAASSQYFSETDANLSAGFPLKSGQSGSVSLAIWVKPGDQSVKRSVIGHGCFYIYINTAGNGAQITGSMKDSGGTPVSFQGTGASITSGAWALIGATWDSGSGAIKVFKNGVDVTNGSPTSATRQTTDTNPFMVGYSSACAGNTYFDGSVAEPAVFATLLSASDFLSIYNYGMQGLSFNAYYAAVSTQPNTAAEDGTRMASAAAKLSLTPGTFWWDSGNTRVYIRTYQDASPAGHTIEAAKRSYNIQSYDKSYVTIQNLSLVYANIYGAYLDGNSGSSLGNQNVILNGLTVQYAAHHGIMVNGNYDDATASANNTVENCTVAYNGWTGIQSGYNVSGLTVQSNIVHDNAWDPAQTYTAGIRNVGGPPGTSVGTNMTFQYNNVYNTAIGNSEVTDGSGIHLDTMGTGNVVRYNLVHGNKLTGIRMELLDAGTVAYNIAYGNSVGLELGRGVSDTVVYNNTAYNNVTNIMVVGKPSYPVNNNSITNNITQSGTTQLSATTGGDNNGTNGTGNTYTYNAFGAAATNFIVWGGSNYSTYATWEAAAGNCGSGGCSHSVQSDPRFTNAAGSDFTLQSSSPAIDAGANLGYTYNMGLDPRSSFPWSTVDQNLYGSGWDIGAFVYIPAGAAQVEPRSDMMSNAAPSATSNHTIVFGAQSAVMGSGGFTVSFQSGFSIPGNLDCGDVDAATSSQFNFNYPSCAATATAWGFSVAGQTITLNAPTDPAANVHVATGTQITVKIGTNASYQQQGVHWLTNPSTPGVYTVSVGGAFGGWGNTLVAIVNEVQLSATVGETLTFTITGLPGIVPSGSDKMTGCITTAPNDDEDSRFTNTVTTTATSVPFDVIAVNSSYQGCQRLGVQTNASNGYTINSREDHPLMSSGGFVIEDICVVGTGSCTPTTTVSFGATILGLGISCVNSSTSASCSTANPDWSGGANFAPIAAESKGLSISKFSGVASATSGTIFAKAKYRLRAPAGQTAGIYSNKVSWIVLPVY